MAKYFSLEQRCQLYAMHRIPKEKIEQTRPSLGERDDFDLRRKIEAFVSDDPKWKTKPERGDFNVIVDLVRSDNFELLMDLLDNNIDNLRQYAHDRY